MRASKCVTDTFDLELAKSFTVGDLLLSFLVPASADNAEGETILSPEVTCFVTPDLEVPPIPDPFGRPFAASTP